MKQHVNEVKRQFNPAFGNRAHTPWKFLKHEIWKFSVKFSKNKAKLRREKLSGLEVKLEGLEQNLSNNEAKEQYKLTEAKLINSMTK